MTRYIGTVLIADVFVLRIVIGIVAGLFAFGWVVADSKGGAYDLMTHIAPWYMWAIAFGSYSYAQFKIAFRKLTRAQVWAVVLCGLAMWLTTVISFADNPNRKMGSGDVMTLFLLIAEVWCGANALSERRKESRNAPRV